MNGYLMIALVVFGATLVSCQFVVDQEMERNRQQDYGAPQNNQYSNLDANIDYYAAPSNKRETYKGYGHDTYRDDGYGHEHHGYGYSTTKKSSKLGLLALLPLLAIPALAALGIPVIAALAGAGTALVPVTTTLGTFVANPGRKKREAIYQEVRKQNPKLAKALKETETLANYLENVKVNVDLQDELMYNHLACSGLLDRSNECLQRLACEFNDASVKDLPDLEREVSAIVLNNILTNKKIPAEVKAELKRAELFGKINGNHCNKYSCSAALQNKLYKSFTGSS